MYRVNEEEGFLIYEVVVKGTGSLPIPIKFTVNDTQGKATSEFYV